MRWSIFLKRFFIFACWKTCLYLKNLCRSTVYRFFCKKKIKNSHHRTIVQMVVKSNSTWSNLIYCTSTRIAVYFIRTALDSNNFLFIWMVACAYNIAIMLFELKVFANVEPRRRRTECYWSILNNKYLLVFNAPPHTRVYEHLRRKHICLHVYIYDRSETLYQLWAIGKL